MYFVTFDVTQVYSNTALRLEILSLKLLASFHDRGRVRRGRHYMKVALALEILEAMSSLVPPLLVTTH